MTRLLETSRGPVEVSAADAVGPWVLYFYGGHESASVALAAALYAELGYRVLAVLRPGYGGTDVGPLSPFEFVSCVDQVCERSGVDPIAAVVGVSFGGQQAVAFATSRPGRVRSLILHSAAPSSQPYADSAIQRLLGPV